MGRRKELAKNTAILTVGRVCTQCINFLLLPFYTAMLSTGAYGTFDLMLTYSMLLLPLVGWQLHQGLFRFMLDDRQNTARHTVLFSTLLFFSVIQCGVYLAVFALIQAVVHVEHAYFLLVYVILQVFNAMLMQFVRGLGKSVVYTIASFIAATATALFNVLALTCFHGGLTGLLVSTLLAQSLTLLYLLAASGCRSYLSLRCIQPAIFKQVGAYSIPLVPNNLAWWVVNASDRTIVSYFLGAAANGVYSIANKFSNVFVNFYNILNLSWAETVSLHYTDADRDEFLTETMNAMFQLFAAGCFGMAACMPFFFPVFIDAKYHDAYPQILILLYAMLFRVLVGLYSCVYVAQKNAKKIAETSISAAVINIVVDLLLIQKIHIFAASISTLAAFLILFLVRYRDVNRTVHMKLKRSVVVGCLLMGGCLLYTYYCGNRRIQAGALVLTIGYAIGANWEMLRMGVRFVRSKLHTK